jgi:hypothetical protein
MPESTKSLEDIHLDAIRMEGVSQGLRSLMEGEQGCDAVFALADVMMKLTHELSRDLEATVEVQRSKA